MTVDIVLFAIRDENLSVLLVERAGHPFKGRWAFPGGFVDADEGLDEAASRELVEETNLSAPAGLLEQLRTYGTPGRDPRTRTFSVAYVGIVPASAEPSAGDDARRAEWRRVGDALDPIASLAFDHSRILADALERVRSKLEYSTAALAFVDEPFTMSDLRRVYEVVWGQDIHRPNFRRKALATRDFVVATGTKAPAARGGPDLELYRRGEGTILYPPILRHTSDPGDANCADVEGERDLPPIEVR